MKQILNNYQILKQQLSFLIDKSGYKQVYIAEKIGMAPSHFSLKKQKSNWNEDEIEKILTIIENEELEDYMLGQMMHTIGPEETINLAELKKQMGWK